MDQQNASIVKWYNNALVKHYPQFDSEWKLYDIIKYINVRRHYVQVTVPD